MKIMMNKDEARRITVIEQTLEGKFTNQQAADLLQLSVRQIKRLKAKARKAGISAIFHGNRNRKPHNAVSEQIEKRIIDLAEGELEGYNFLHMQEVLAEEHDLDISYSSLSRLLKKHGIKSPKGKRRRKKHRPREAKAYKGELVQLDASKYDWFSDGSYAHLHAAIDDATNQVLGLYFTKEETFEAYAELVLQINREHGLPHAFYADGRSIFFYDSRVKKKLSLEEELAGIKEKKPQFARACQALGIKLIQAHTPQAKGLVERLWGSLQDRLPKDFFRLGIHNMEDANKYLSGYILEWNRIHSHTPQKKGSFFSPKLSEKILHTHFAKHQYRILSSGYTFSFEGQK